MHFLRNNHVDVKCLVCHERHAEGTALSSFKLSP